MKEGVRGGDGAGDQLPSPVGFPLRKATEDESEDKLGATRGRIDRGSRGSRGWGRGVVGRGAIDDDFFVSPRSHEGHEAVNTRSGGGGIIRVAAASVFFYTVAQRVAPQT